MQLKEIYKLLLEGRTKPVSLQEARKYYETAKSVWSSSNTQIFRGIADFDEPFGVVQPSNYKRRSENTNNYYTLMIDNIVEWEDYPKRSKSIVCTTDPTYADTFGNLYLIVPLGNYKVGIASEDIWGSFEVPLDEFNNYLNKTSEIVYGSREIPEDNFLNFKKVILDMDERLKSGETHDGRDYQDVIEDYNPPPSHSMYEGLYNYQTFLEDYLNGNYSNLFEYFRYLLDPEQNDFKVEKYDKSFRVEREKEVWTSGDCLTIKYEKSILNEFFGVEHNWDELFGLTD